MFGIASVGRFEVDGGLAGQRRKPPRVTPDRRPMDEAVFWEVIGEAGGDVERLVQRFEHFGLRAIRAFQKLLYEKTEAANRHDLWAVAYFMRGGCGDDAFLYLRAWLVLKGRERFEAALARPESVADAIGDADPQCEAMLYAADEAYERRKDAPMPPVRHHAGPTRGEEWTEDELPELFPGLFPDGETEK